jgi:hypothetical protein
VAELAFAAAIYFAVRELIEGASEAATQNASQLLRFEHALGIDVEHGLQTVVLHHPTLATASNHIYVWLHWPFLILALVVLFVRDECAYRQLKDVLVVSGIVGLVFFGFFPVAPPRFMPGFVGTVSQAERQHFLPYPMAWSNSVASLPSFHAGWTLVAALLLAQSSRSTIMKIIAFLPGVLVAVAVVATGNHYVVDVLLGSGLSLGALVALRRRETKAATVRAVLSPLPVLWHSGSRARR